MNGILKNKLVGGSLHREFIVNYDHLKFACKSVKEDRRIVLYVFSLIHGLKIILKNSIDLRWKMSIKKE